MNATYEIFQRIILVAGILLTAMLGMRNDTAVAQIPEMSTGDLLRFRIETGGSPLNIAVGKELIHAAAVLPVFYERRGYQPAWTDNRGTLPQVEALLKSIRGANSEGLKPEDYHLGKIETILSEIHQTTGFDQPPNPHQAVDLDLLLTDAFLIYGTHLLGGRTDPEKLHPSWLAGRRETDLARQLEDAINLNRIEETLAGLLPNHAGYHRLRESLATYREIGEIGGWPTIPSGSKLQAGDRSARILLLRQRLAAELFISKTAVDDPTFFDKKLELALRRFQKQNGLEADGILGPQTLLALNISVERRVRQIVVNMERWRWLPQDLGHRYILVNIAGFKLDVVERETTVLNMRVVVGKTYRKTPVFSDKITYLVVNPFWGVPDSIARKDILPKIKKDPNFLKKQKIRVFKGWGTDTREIDPDKTDWAKLAQADLPYRFQQNPGPQNALGRIKYMFPNRFNVYLHDTPSKELFGKARRDFSSGCIRVEKPAELAEYLLRNHPEWPPHRIRATLTGSDFSTTTIKLIDPVNIHILYWTAWVDDEGHIHFQPDIYNRDTGLDAALQMAPPRPMK